MPDDTTDDITSMDIDSHLDEAGFQTRGEEGLRGVVHAIAAVVKATQEQTAVLRELIEIIKD